MQTYSKRYAFERLFSPQRDPRAWQGHLDRFWAGGGSWSVAPLVSAEGARDLIDRFMPELLPDFTALLPAVGLEPGAAQALALYNQRPFWAGCSESIARRPSATTLIRNYDVGVDEFYGCFRYEDLAEGGWILGTAEGGLGYLDGMNDRGLAVSLTFGGRFVVGDGFAVLLVIRWLLQTCATVTEALARLERVPHRLAQNLLLVDRSGDHAVAYVSPDRPMVVDRDIPATTNHQREVEDPRHAEFTRTVERLAHMAGKDGALTLADFLQPPLYNQRFGEHFGTLYTVEYDPVAGTAHYAWPGRDLLLRPDSPATALDITLTQP